MEKQKTKSLKKELTIDEAKTEIVNKTIAEIKDPLDDQTQGGDSTDGVITLFEDIFQLILDKFKELIKFSQYFEAQKHHHLRKSKR